MELGLGQIRKAGLSLASYELPPGERRVRKPKQGEAGTTPASGSDLRDDPEGGTSLRCQRGWSAWWASWAGFLSPGTNLLQALLPLALMAQLPGLLSGIRSPANSH